VAMTDTLEHRPLREIVAERIRMMIIGGTLQPGERLIEGHIADQLGVSRNPVREAIRSLEATGLIEVVPRKGAHVSRIDVEEVRQIQELRFAIESLAAELAAARRTDDDVARLRECIEQGLAATKSGDKVGAAAWHRNFHIALERAAGNPYIERALSPLRHRTELMFSVLQEERGAITWKEHRAIMNAVARSDAKAARDLMREHISIALRHFEKT
jgi:DNA-binding GntR family transcriptional regulator